MDGDVFDFIEARVRRECQQLISNPERAESKDAMEAFRFLKRNINFP